MIANTNFTRFALGGDCAHRAIRKSQRVFIAQHTKHTVAVQCGGVLACLPLEIPRAA